MQKHLLIIPILLVWISAFAQQPNHQIDFRPLTESVWIHTSYKQFQTMTIPANGLSIRTEEGWVLVDIPWDDNQTKQLLAKIKEEYQEEVTLAIVTHAHDDRMGGIQVLLDLGIKVIGIDKSTQITEEQGLPMIEPALSYDATLEVGGMELICYYPGAGHAPDNIVVYLPKQQVLHAGCFSKSAQAQDLGNIADADLESWPIAIEKVQGRFPKAKLLVPGHGKEGDQTLLEHTAALLQQAGQREK